MPALYKKHYLFKPSEIAKEPMATIYMQATSGCTAREYRANALHSEETMSLALLVVIKTGIILLEPFEV